MSNQSYVSPLTSRYASKEMSQLFSPMHRAHVWRQLWIALARAQQRLGLPIKDDQIKELEQTADNIDLATVAEYEKKLRHDVMAHIHAWGDLCPNAKGILHLGATSCTITDNGDLIILREAMRQIRAKIVSLIGHLSEFARSHRSLPCLAFTHYQPAQPTTLGKRATLWIYDFLLDLQDLDHRLQELPFFGIKGTTGTQASFLTLFDGDHKKVDELEQLIADSFKFSRIVPVSGQTYSRKLDSQILHALSGLGSSSHKMCTDLRLLANLKQVEEPFESKQIGSSAMPYKRNPMRSERVCSLARFLLNLSVNPDQTHSVQWFERTLDDSANRRLVLAESFLTADSILNLLLNISQGLVVYPKMIEKQLRQELPFMATEDILMHAVKLGGDRQELHEKLRQHSVNASRRIKEEGKDNDLFDRLASDPAFHLKESDLEELSNPQRFIGRSAEQVDHFLSSELSPILAEYKEIEIPGFTLSV